MANYVMEHSGEELDEAIGYVLDNYKDVTPVTATANDVVYGKVIVTPEGPVMGTYQGVVPPASWRKTAEGDPAVVSDGMAGWPLYSMAGKIVPFQVGSGDPAPDNVRSITGRTLARLRYAGKNLPPKHAVGTVTSGDITATFNSDGSVRVTGELGASTVTIFYTNATWQRCLPIGVPLTVSGSSAHVAVQIRYTTAAGSGTTAASSTGGAEATATIPVTARASNVRLSVSAGSGEIDETVYPMVRLASDTDSTWAEPSGAELYTGAFPADPGTVYGGTMDFKTGVLTVDRIAVTYDGTESWTAQTITGRTLRRMRRSVPAQLKAHNNTAATFEGVSNILSVGTFESTTTTEYSWWYYSTGLTYIYCFFDPTTWTGAGSTDEEKWQAFLAGMAAGGNPLTLCVPLAEPVEYQLDRQQMPALRPGTNTFWTDSGGVTVTYYSVPDDPTNPTVQSLQSSPAALSMAAPTADPMDEPEEVEEE